MFGKARTAVARGSVLGGAVRLRDGVGDIKLRNECKPQGEQKAKVPRETPVCHCGRRRKEMRGERGEGEKARVKKLRLSLRAIGGETFQPIRSLFHKAGRMKNNTWAWLWSWFDVEPFAAGCRGYSVTTGQLLKQPRGLANESKSIKSSDWVAAATTINCCRSGRDGRNARPSVCYARRADRRSIIPSRADETARPVRAGEGSRRAREEGGGGESVRRGWCGVAS